MVLLTKKEKKTVAGSCKNSPKPVAKHLGPLEWRDVISRDMKIRLLRHGYLFDGDKKMSYTLKGVQMFNDNNDNNA